MKTKCDVWRVMALAGLGVALVGGCKKEVSLVDDGGGRTTNDFPSATADVFQEMDGGIALSPEEIQGRNNWNLWCGGDEQFWERMSRESFGLIDLLKTLDTHGRGSRFREMGLINEPGFKQAGKPDEFGLWLDERVEPERPGIDPKVYGKSTGVMGFRLFPNPDFKGEAVKNWNAEKFYTDTNYAVSPDLVRPYRVGVSCGACHIAFHPLRPPADPENPKLENLSSSIGNQYIREGRTFANNVRPGGLFWEMNATQPPGTSDTSRIATDHMNNPNNINPIFDLGARESIAHEEMLAGGSLLLPGAKARMPVAHILKDGADSVGVPGATIRVYVNIGMYSQHWLQQHNPLIGFGPQKPFDIATAQKNSVYWRATENRLAGIAAFFRRIQPFHLADAPGGVELITKDEAVMRRGKEMFADHCAQCHSSKQPPAGADEDKWFREAVMKPDFLTGNFLSDEKRYPLAKIKSNAARALGTNAKKGHVWHNFSSQTYKELPEASEIDVWNPYTGLDEKFSVKDVGPGVYRTPSLISIWTSAPFLHNNALGKFTGDPSVPGRMAAFNDAIEKLLWPAKRDGTNSIWRTSRAVNLQVARAVIPEPLQSLLKLHYDRDGYFRIGYIPKGTPVNLIANLNPDADKKDLAKLLIKLKAVLIQEKIESLNEAELTELLRQEIAPLLWKANKCPDFIEDKGHYFGTELPDADKRALIEFVKTF